MNLYVCVCIYIYIYLCIYENKFTQINSHTRARAHTQAGGLRRELEESVDIVEKQQLQTLSYRSEGGFS